MNLRKKFRLIVRTLRLSAIAGILVTSVTVGYAETNPFCPWIFLPSHTAIHHDDSIASRAALIESLKKTQLPAFVKDTPNGPIAVIQVNAVTSADPNLAEFLEHSIGTQVVLQPDWKNDHGSLRMGSFMIDADTPGARSFGEIHDTGLAWKNLNSYLPRRGPDSYTILEVAYSLTEPEMAVAKTYQRMRRAAIVRVPFTFGGNQPDTALPNMLTGGGEHCFLFCSGSQLQNQILEIRAKLKRYGISNIDAFLTSTVTEGFIERADRIILDASLDARSLSPNILKKIDSESILEAARLSGAAIAKNEQVQFLNWIYGLVASERYQKLIKELQISSQIGVADAVHPRATAILIYAHPASAPTFQSAEFEAAGIFTKWAPFGVHPLPRGYNP